MTAQKHCWHSDGASWSTGFGGGETVRCCRCGLVSSRGFRLKDVPLKGHGPHVTQQKPVYEDPDAEAIHPCTAPASALPADTPTETRATHDRPLAETREAELRAREGPVKP